MYRKKYIPVICSGRIKKLSTIDLSKKTILITGVAGFIGASLATELLKRYTDVMIVGLDNLNDYYDVSLKEYRLQSLVSDSRFNFIKLDISDKQNLDGVFLKYTPDIVVNLAAQAGVRYSITHPDVYIQSNIVGFFNILEACRSSLDSNRPVQHLVYASSSSVYGSNQKVPYSTDDKVDNPVSLYAATKKSNELMAHAYSKLYDIPSTGLRFFTVYGPAGRPDMAYFKFAEKMIRGEAIDVYNNGDMYRDFTYIDDIVEGLIRVISCSPELSDDGVRYKVYNIGNTNPVKLLDFINILYKSLQEAGCSVPQLQMNYLPMQQGDVYQTFADISDMEKDFSFKPSIGILDGLALFSAWYSKNCKKSNLFDNNND